MADGTAASLLMCADGFTSALIERLPEMVVVMGADLRITYANQRLLDVMGYSQEQVIGSHVFDYVHPDDTEYMASTWAVRAANPGELGILIQARGRNADGTWRPVEILGVSMLGEDPIDGMVMTMRDLTRKLAGGDDAGRHRAMLDRTTDVVLQLDREGRIVFANRRLTSSFGFDQDEVVGTHFSALVPERERRRCDAWVAALVDRGDGADSRVRLLIDVDSDVDGRPTIEWHGTNQLDDPLIGGVIVSGRDVSDLVAMEERLRAQADELRHNAEHDAMTGLLNRAAFSGEITARVIERRARADGGDVVLLFCDLDRFKEINDTYGHAVGDHVLRVAAERLRGCVRRGDVVARWGGDEFTILLGGSPSPEAVAELTARIRDRLGAPIAEGARTMSIGVSIGVGRAPVKLAEVVEMLSAADESMYRRKTGRLRATPRDR